MKPLPFLNIKGDKTHPLHLTRKDRLKKHQTPFNSLCHYKSPQYANTYKKVTVRFFSSFHGK